MQKTAWLRQWLYAQGQYIHRPFDLAENRLLKMHYSACAMNPEIHLFAGLTLLGTIEAKVVDVSMGVIGGILKPISAYYTNYQSFFQAHLETPDWKGLAALDLKAISPLTGEIVAEGGIDITDVEGFDEVDVNVCGIGFQQMKWLFPEC